MSNPLAQYYDAYWTKRTATVDYSVPPIRENIPGFLRRYSQYGAILHQLTPGSRVLDIGCGEGNVSAVYKQQKGCRVYGLDISPKAVSRAKRRGIQAQKHDLNVFPYPFRSAQFDTITLSDVLEHLMYPVKTLQEIRRLLRNNGKVVVEVPNCARLENRIAMLFGDPRDLLHWERYGDGTEHLQWFSLPKMKDMFQQAGYTDIHFLPVGLPLTFMFGRIGFPNLQKILLVVAGK